MQNQEQDQSLNEERQQKLYKFLVRNGNKFITQKSIATYLHKYYPFSDDTKNFHDTRARMLMTCDVQAINDSADYEKIIISSPQGLKIATKKEFGDYITGEYRLAFSKLSRVRNKERKGKRDGQITFRENAVDAVIHAFLEENGSKPRA